MKVKVNRKLGVKSVAGTRKRPGRVWVGRGISGGTLEIPTIMAENITKPRREH